MTDDELNQTLCRLTGLTDDQLAGVDRLTGLTGEQAGEFTEVFEEAWQENGRVVRAAKAAFGDAARAVARIETEIGALCQRERRWPTDHEQARIDAARDQRETARAAVQAAQERFKAGVTDEQFEARRALR